jgi:hypothetical protein
MVHRAGKPTPCEKGCHRPIFQCHWLNPSACCQSATSDPHGGGLNCASPFAWASSAGLDCRTPVRKSRGGDRRRASAHHGHGGNRPGPGERQHTPGGAGRARHAPPAAGGPARPKHARCRRFLRRDAAPAEIRWDTDKPCIPMKMEGTIPSVEISTWRSVPDFNTGLQLSRRSRLPAFRHAGTPAENDGVGKAFSCPDTRRSGRGHNITNQQGTLGAVRTGGRMTWPTDG